MTPLEIAVQPRTPSISSHVAHASLALQTSLVHELRRRRRAGEAVTAAELLQREPGWEQSKSLVMALAYEEFCLRREAGDELELHALVAAAPQFAESLGRLAVVHRWVRDALADDPALLGLEPDYWPEAGDELEGFHLLGELGRGAFAHVYLAAEPALGDRLVALKASLSGGDEAETLGQLKHPNIVPVYSVRRHGPTNLTLVCMPYLGLATWDDLLPHGRGGLASGASVLQTIAAVNRLGQPPEPMAADPALVGQPRGQSFVHLAAQLADALAYAHAKGICHRDLKPSNVLLAPDGRPMLLDFNLSVHADGAARLVGGTPAFMAAEQIEATLIRRSRDPADNDPRSDIFSLGAMLYQSLTGQPPFGVAPPVGDLAKLAAEMIARQRRGLQPLRSLNPAVDRLLARLVESMLAFDPADRPKDCVEVAARLRACLAWRPRLRGWARAHRKLVAAALAATLGLSAAGGYGWSNLDPPAVRALKRGQQACGRGEYRAAIEALTDAAQMDPQNAVAWFLRGRARQKLGLHSLAQDDYSEAMRWSEDPRIAACFADAQARCIHFDRAIGMYAMLASRQISSAAILNNLGFCYMRTDIVDRRLDRAKECLDAALELNPALQPALLNRALAEFQQSVEQDRATNERCREDISKAIEIGPKSANLFHLAALIACHKSETPERLNLAVEYLEQARRLGYDPANFSDDLAFAPLKSLPAFQELALRSPGAGGPLKAEHFVDPLDGWPPDVSAATQVASR